MVIGQSTKSVFFLSTATLNDDMMLLSARERLRSKSGCDLCRRRRKKCDEVKPACGPCRRLRLYCPFLDNNGNRAGDRLDYLRTTSTSLTTRSTVVTRLATSTVHLNLSPGHSKEICAVLQYFGDNQKLFLQTPDERPSLSLLFLLPLASASPMVLAALSAFLSLFMPTDWIQRTSFPLRLSHQAVSQLSTAISHGHASAPSDQAILTAGLLYFFDHLKLHAFTDSEAKFSHLYGVGAMLQRRMRTPPALGRSLPMPLSSIESYMYHLILSSTINYDVVTSGITPAFIDNCMRLIARERQTVVSDLRLLSVPAALLSVLFKLSCLREEIRTGTVSRSTAARALEASRVLDGNTKVSPTTFAALDLLYTYARRALFAVLAKTILSHYGDQWEGDLDHVIGVNWHAAELREKLDLICSARGPRHVATWPLFIIGTTCRVDELRLKVTEGLKRMVEGRLNSAQGALEMIELSRVTQLGENILLSSRLKTALLF